MPFSIRDRQTSPAFRVLSTQSGQAVMEYILVLAVTVMLILGGIYQLNSAFKAWANNYFGSYIACLLETGELPTISGNPGDSGICNQLFQPFSLAAGRPLKPMPDPQSDSRGAAGGGVREGNRGGGGPGSSQRISPMRGFGSGSRGLNAGGGGRGAGKSAASTYTGDTGVSDYGGGYSTRMNKVNRRNTTELNTRFAFEEEREKNRTRKVASSARSSSEGEGPRGRVPFKPPKPKTEVQAADAPMGFTDFVRFLIIAAIVIALVMFLGGQALQIGKSMER